ncbi:MAG: HAD family hydrolase [Clostridiales bacterium]|jgi:HAD superfamily hydrolase (TIGR01549 family)|nr:HAD family hydrolase [Clostridiales bacterium]
MDCENAKYKIVPKDYDYYLFDFDLTLFDTSEPSALSYKAAFAAIGAEYNEKNFYIYLSESLTDTFARCCSDKSKYALFESTFYDVSHSQMWSAKIYSDVRETLELLKNRHKKIAIVTNKDAEAVNIILKANGFESNFFNAVVTCDEIKNCKPAPDALLLCLKKLNEQTHENLMAVYIGDARNDILAAQNAGIDSYFIVRKHNKSNEYAQIAIHDLRSIAVLPLEKK